MQPQNQPTQGQVAQQPAGGTEQGGEPAQPTGAGSRRPPPGGQQAGLALRDVETPQQRAAADDVARAIQVCEWCADQCIQLADPGMIECVRRCRDVSRLGGTATALLARNSPYAQPALDVLEQAVQACGQECSQHSHAHCQECAQVLGQTSQSLRQLLGPAGGQTTAVQ